MQYSIQVVCMYDGIMHLCDTSRRPVRKLYDFLNNYMERQYIFFRFQ